MFSAKTVLPALVAIVAMLAEAGAQQLPIENIQLRGDRFRGLSYGEMTAEQRVMLDHVVNSARAVTNTTGNGPFNVLLRSPEIGDLSQQLGNAIRFSSGLSGRLREMATLMAGRAWTSQYEWYAHARYAADEGIAPDVIDAIAEHRTPELAAMPEEDAMVWRVADELLYTRRVTDETFREALAVLGERRLLAAATIAAYYEYISMILNVDRYPLPADAPPGAEHAVMPLPADALYRTPKGTVTARAPLVNEDAERAIAALGAAVNQDAALPHEVRQTRRERGDGTLEPRSLPGSRRPRAPVCRRAAPHSRSDGCDVRRGDARLGRAAPRQSAGLDGLLEHSLRAGRPRGRCVRALITTGEENDESPPHAPKCCVAAAGLGRRRGVRADAGSSSRGSRLHIVGAAALPATQGRG